MNPSTNPAAPTLAGRKLVQVALTTRDPERSKRFYRDVLGLPLLFEVSNMTFYQMGELRLMVGVEPSMTPGGFRCSTSTRPTSTRWAASWSSAACASAAPSPCCSAARQGELKLREFKDPDGNSLALMGFVPK
jgi:catechol 2,3-dioxygenase-like lactoylglutathione lyase family enzyme